MVKSGGVRSRDVLPVEDHRPGIKRSVPVMTLNAVDLPDPLGPMMPRSLRVPP
jgi:hypothetical protein